MTPDSPAAPAPRHVVVTGASRGIGRAVAAALVAAGDRVLALSRTGEGPDGAAGLPVDVTDPVAVSEAVARSVEERGPVDVLIAAAGASADALAARTSPGLWDEVLTTNLTGSFNAARAVLPSMMRARRGRIVLVSSVIAARGGVGLAAYGASKGGLEGLTRSLARELAPRDITVNAVAPGPTATPLFLDGKDEATVERLAAQAPLERLGTPADIAETVAFLAGPGRWVNGQVLFANGGIA